MHKLTLLIITLVLLITACGEGSPFAEPTITPSPTPTCAQQTEVYRQEAADWLERFEDATELAASTSRMSLAGPISDMQTLARDVKDIEHPPCADMAQARMENYAATMVDAFLMFLSQEDDADVNATFDEALLLQAQVYESLAELADD